MLGFCLLFPDEVIMKLISAAFVCINRQVHEKDKLQPFG